MLKRAFQMTKFRDLGGVVAASDDDVVVVVDWVGNVESTIAELSSALAINLVVVGVMGV